MRRLVDRNISSTVIRDERAALSWPGSEFIEEVRAMTASARVSTISDAKQDYLGQAQLASEAMTQRREPLTQFRLDSREAQRLVSKEVDMDAQPTSLIEASRVQGTNVYNPAGEKLGAVHDLMIDKRTGNTSYAVISFGGFLGVGEDYFPIPWSKLKYDEKLGGYVTDIDIGALEGAPAYAAGAAPRWGDRAYEEELHRFYGASPYWGNPIVP